MSNSHSKLIAAAQSVLRKSAIARYAEAISEFKETLRLWDGHGKSLTHYHLGLAYLRSGDRESALKEYEILKKLNEELAKRLLDEIKGSSRTAALEKQVSWKSAPAKR